MLYEVGLEMFLKHGYEKTNLSDIIKITGGSLSTVYEHFGNKEGFFEAIILKSMDDFHQNLHKKLLNTTCNSLEEFLIYLANAYMQVYFSEKSILLTRIIYAQGYKNDGKMAKAFEEKYADLMRNGLVKYIDQFNQNNILKFNDYATLIEEFCTLIVEPEFTNMVFNVQKTPPTKEQKDKKIKRVVDMFLHGYLKT